jgi:hypothetical protein
MIQLPPMIKTPKEGRGAGALERNNHNFMMHSQNHPTHLPITPASNGAGQLIGGGGLRASYHQQMHQ